MPIPLMTFDEFVIAQGLVFRAELAFAGVAAAGFAYTGVTTGPDEIVVLQRAYTSSESILTAELYEASFTGGTPARTWNRRLASANVNPAGVFQGVVPGALGSIITGVTLRAGSTTGSSSVNVPGDESRLYLKPNTQYVVRYINQGAGAATIANGFDFRKVLKGNWDGMLVSA